MFLDAVLVYNFLLNEPHERIRAVAVVGGRILTTGGNTDYFDSSTKGGSIGGDGTEYDRYNKPYVGVEPIG